jgi:hypothetical protein
VGLTFCADITLSPVEQLLARSYLGRPVYSANGFACTEPVPSYLVFADQQGRVVPGIPFVAAFGLWGGNIISGTTATTITIPYQLEHTSPTAQAFDLQPIHSQRGWTYSWAAMNGSPISRLTVNPLPVPIWQHGPPNVQVIGTGLPPCAHLLDTIAITATSVTTPSVQAATVTQVQVYPDPARCPVADVGIAQIASSNVITAGQRVTFTLTITNYETVAITARVTETLSPAQAVQGAALPAGCTRSGGKVTCPAVNLTASGSRTLTIGVDTRSTFGGVLSGWAEADPAAATDVAHYDNEAGPVDVTVVWSGGRLSLPLLLRDRGP